MCCLDQGFLNHLLFLFFHPIAHSDEVTFDPLLSASLYITSHSKERTASSLLIRSFSTSLFFNPPLSFLTLTHFFRISLPLSLYSYTTVSLSLSLSLSTLLFLLNTHTHTSRIVTGMR